MSLIRTPRKPGDSYKGQTKSLYQTVRNYLFLIRIYRHDHNGLCGYRSWKSLITSIEFAKFSASYQVLSNGYPTHLTRYYNFLFFPTRRESRKSSTSNSSSSSIITGGGGDWIWPDNGSSESFRSNETWNVLWIFIESGSFSVTLFPLTCITSNGPTNLSSSFFEGLVVLIFFVKSYALFLITYSGASFLCLSAHFFWFSRTWVKWSFAKAHTFSISSVMFNAFLFSSFSRADPSESIGSKRIHGSNP